MENVTKALLIAAGILLAIMILTLLIVFWGQLSGYYTQQHNDKIVEQEAKINAKFENYNGQTIRGNELVSVMNMVIDYNNAVAEMDGFDKVIMSVDFKGCQNKSKDNFKYSDSDRSIFSGNIITNSQSSDANLKNVANIPETIRLKLQNAGFDNVTDAQLQKLSANIYNIVNINSADTNGINTRNRKLQNILLLSDDEVRALSASKISTIEEVTKQYYQYTQFKRAMFKCTGVEHNTTGNARVNKITFDIVLLDNGSAKFN